MSNCDVQSSYQTKGRRLADDLTQYDDAMRLSSKKSAVICRSRSNTRHEPIPALEYHHEPVALQRQRPHPSVLCTNNPFSTKPFVAKKALVIPADLFMRAGESLKNGGSLVQVRWSVLGLNSRLACACPCVEPLVIKNGNQIYVYQRGFLTNGASAGMMKWRA